MHNSMLVGVRDGSSKCGHKSGAFDGWLRRPGKAPGQAAAFEKLHREVRPSFKLTHVKDLHDMGVCQRSDRFCFSYETCPFLPAGKCPRQQHLQGNQTIELQMPSSKDDAHAAVANQFLQRVTGDVWKIAIEQRLRLSN